MYVEGSDILITLCKPRYDFLYERTYPTLDEPISDPMPFKRAENYAFAHEKVPIRSYTNPNDDYIDRICVFYPRNICSELIYFSPEDFDKKFEILSYTDW